MNNNKYTQSKEIDLLRAMMPFFDEQKQENLENAIKMMQMFDNYKLMLSNDNDNNSGNYNNSNNIAHPSNNSNPNNYNKYNFK